MPPYPLFPSPLLLLLKFDTITTFSRANLISPIYGTHNFYCVWTAAGEMSNKAAPARCQDPNNVELHCKKLASGKSVGKTSLTCRQTEALYTSNNKVGELYSAQTGLSTLRFWTGKKVVELNEICVTLDCEIYYSLKVELYIKIYLFIKNVKELLKVIHS